MSWCVKAGKSDGATPRDAFEQLLKNQSPARTPRCARHPASEMFCNVGKRGSSPRDATLPRSSCRFQDIAVGGVSVSSGTRGGPQG